MLFRQKPMEYTIIETATGYIVCTRREGSDKAVVLKQFQGEREDWRVKRYLKVQAMEFARSQIGVA